MRLLIIEDIDDRHDRIVSALGGQCYPRRARTAAEARAALDEEPFDAILLDYDLDCDGAVPVWEVGTGMDVVVRLIERDRVAPYQTPVIVHSKNPTASVVLVQRLLDSGHPVAWIPEPRRDTPIQADLIRRVLYGMKHAI